MLHGLLALSLFTGQNCEIGRSRQSELDVYAEDEYGQTVMLKTLDIHAFEVHTIQTFEGSA